MEMRLEKKIEIIEAQSKEEVDQVAERMREFVLWLHDRYTERIWIIEKYFEPDAWESELASLGEKYAAPDGALLLAKVDGKPVGCVMAHKIGEGVCEMKRMFVQPEFHGLGLGRALASKLIEVARRQGYRSMRLDTGPFQLEAQALYGALGFRRIDCYYNCPEDLKKELVFMERAPL
jgi:GNAT superfamily N-acetyltransferase